MASMNPGEKYKPFPPLKLPNRKWPDNIITQAPAWCSVDLRDGNQALIEPMEPGRKKRFFETLIAAGFKEIEVGFPSASASDFDFLRHIIEHNLIPDDVTIQVLTQARKDLIERTFDSLKGCKKAIVHFYNSTSTLQRRVVFGMERDGITALATEGAKIIRALSEKAQTEGLEITHQYSPESFTSTEMDYAIEICAAVTEIFDPSPEKKLILNLPATVEIATPNIHADQIEYFCRHFPRREDVIISLHPHNDRGAAVAATELALMAGAERVEGTLFGNGERTGNVDLVTLALNLYTQGVNPNLDFSDINALRETVEYCNRLPVHPRHPYTGELVFTAFSGSHQDAIKKGFVALEKSNNPLWEVPYLPIDPSDLGRNYEAVIRINSQSGKGGVAYIMENDHGFELPRRLQIEFSQLVQNIADQEEREIETEELKTLFTQNFINRENQLSFLSHHTEPVAGHSEQRILHGEVEWQGKACSVKGEGNGPIDAYLNAIKPLLPGDFRLLNYHQHALGEGSSATSVTYIEMERPGKGEISMFGVGVDANIVTASLRAVTSAVNRLLEAT